MVPEPITRLTLVRGDTWRRSWVLQNGAGTAIDLAAVYVQTFD